MYCNFFCHKQIIRYNFYANIRDIKPTQPTLTFPKEPFTLINRMYLKNRIRNLTPGLIKPSQLFLTFYQLAPEAGQIAWCRSRCEKLPIAQDEAQVRTKSIVFQRRLAAGGRYGCNYRRQL